MFATAKKSIAFSKNGNRKTQKRSCINPNFRLYRNNFSDIKGEQLISFVEVRKWRINRSDYD